MNLKSYILNEDKSEKIKEKIVAFFMENPKPKDKQIHKFAENENIDTHKFEEILYEILGEILSSGKSKDFKGEYDKDELNKGVKIELEHTNNKAFATKIAKDHLAEMPDYYTKLIKMENKNE